MGLPALNLLYRQPALQGARLPHMPRYYFHFDDGGSRKIDPDGIVLPDAEAAWYQGVRSACDLLREGLGVGRFREGQRFEIEDEDGQPISAVRFEEVIGLFA